MTKKALNSYFIAQKKTESRLSSLAEMALNNFDADMIFEALYKSASDVQKEYIRDAMKKVLTENGGIFIDVPELDKRSKVENFLCSEIFPCYNEQQTQMFI